MPAGIAPGDVSSGPAGSWIGAAVAALLADGGVLIAVLGALRTA
jgi:hypothetical protein